MIGPSLKSKGGIASLCAEYKRAGIFDRLGIEFLPSFRTAGAAVKLGVAAKCALRLVFLLVCGRVRLVHVHMASGSSVWRKGAYCLLAWLARVPYVVHLHSGKLPSYLEAAGPRRQGVFAWLLTHAAQVLVLSTERVRWVQGLDLRLRGLQVLPNCVAMPAGPAVATQAGTVLFMGRLEPEKGMDSLVQAWAHVARVHPHAILQLAGEGDQAQYAAALRQLGVDQSVEFLGWVDGAKKDALFAAADVFVLPSRYEGLPMAMLEAMSRAVPCVATPVGGVPDIVTDGVDGRLVPLDNAQALADALCSLLADPTLRNALGLQAQHAVRQRFSTQAVEAQLKTIYNLAEAA